MMLTFEQPIVLFLLLLIPGGIYYLYGSKNRGGRFSFPFRLWGGEGFYPGRGFLSLILVFSGILFWTGVFFLIVSLAGPQITRQERVYTHQGKEIVFVIDQSPSMSATDFPPENRFETAKDMIGGFIEERVNDAIGLVGFGDDAVLWVPPTTDYAFLLNRLEERKILELGTGTSVGMGLSVASLHLSRSGNPDKVIVLLTDGDNNSGEIQPEMASRIAGELGIKIYCIGIGSNADVPVDFVDPESGLRITGSAKGAFNENLLMKIAESTGGGYFRAMTPGVLQSIFLTIDTLESTEKKMKIQVATRSIHRVFILLSFIMLLLNFLIRKLALREVL
jgi:Ca-activated chloride channel family protein